MGIESAHTPSSGADPRWPPQLVARVVYREDGHRECTIHPADATPQELLTTWIAAVDDAFVDVLAMR